MTFVSRAGPASTAQYFRAFRQTVLTCAVLVITGLISAFGAFAQSDAPANAAPKAEAPKPADDKCLALADVRTPGGRIPGGTIPRRTVPSLSIHRVAATPAKLLPYQIRLKFLGHATFLIESAKGVKIATDYAVPIFPPDTPNIATMNNAHSSHFTYTPQKEIAHVLPGWNDQGGAIIHDMTVEDVRVRNVPTNVRSWNGETREFGNSIFVFEIGALCVAHLGHLHHPLTTQQLANVGQMDVVLAPVDGSFTLDTPGMLEVIETMNPRVVVPMHYFTPTTLNRFLTLAGTNYGVKMMDKAEIIVSKDALPLKTEIWVLPGY
ncbi:MAG: MBL fold metallo-hydrolase [Pseudomonadota bacterium]